MKNAVHTHVAELPAHDPRTKLLNAKIKKEGAKPEALIEILHTAQNAYGHLPLKVMAHISRALKLPPSRVYATVSFYHFFSMQSKGEHTCLVCTGTACYVKGAQQVLKAVESAYGIHAGQVTADGKLGVQVARCVGACGLAPVVLLDDEVKAKATGKEIVEGIRALLG
jgi:bidirectional [NiFe] hydrogenase diaphorase subunit